MTTSVNLRRYNRLVEFAKARGGVPGYGERHHIVPRSEGGTDDPANLVVLTAREHFLAHWLLYRIYRTPASARAFKLMVHDQKRRRGRDYASARELMATSMLGDNNVSRRADVRAILKARAVSPFAGKKRPEHAALMRARGALRGPANPFFGRGAEQAGAKNRMARRVVGLHVFYGINSWATATDASRALGVSIQAVAQAIKYAGRSKGWRLEYAT